MSTQPEAWDREIQKVNDAAQEASFRVYRDHQAGIDHGRAQLLLEKILALVADEAAAFEEEDRKWEENLRRQIGAARADNLRKQCVRERLPAAVSKLAEKLDPEAPLSPEDVRGTLLLHSRPGALLAPAAADGGQDRTQTPDGHQPHADRAPLMTPPARDPGGPSGLKRTREQSMAQRPGAQLPPTQEGNVSRRSYPFPVGTTGWLWDEN